MPNVQPKLNNKYLDKSILLRHLIALIILFNISIVDLSAQCPMICNKSLNISLDSTCNIRITEFTLLDTSVIKAHCSYEVIIMGSNGVPKPGSPFVNASDIGKTYDVKVISDHNSCWGRITVEDKLPPTILCPANITLNCFDPRVFAKPTAVDNCGIIREVRELSNEVEELGCSAAFAAIRRISYIAFDNSGNQSAVCTRQIFYAKSGLDSISFPLNRDDVEDGVLDCDNANGWDLNRNGYPDINETGVPRSRAGFALPNTSFCKINTTFVDQVLPGCGASRKILRSWSVMDWCTNRVATKIQIIKIVDNKGPQANIVITNTSLVADAYTCLAEWRVVTPTDIIDCSTVTFSVSYILSKADGTFGVDQEYQTANVVTQSGVQFIRRIPVGKIRVRYRLEDACGNFTLKFIELTIIDRTPPDVACVQFTVVTLSTTGNASIFSKSLDNKSRDNCSKITFEARRMTASCGNSNLLWTDEIKFCCEDVAKDIMVSLRVTDEYGNSNTCMVTVRVQDKIDPKITCPSNITINCGQSYNNLALVGSATAIDNCANPVITRRDSLAINQCGVGTVRRRWYATDRDGRVDSCTQFITIRGLPPLTYDDIAWNVIRDTTIEGCMNSSIDPKVTGEPKWKQDSCRLIAANWKDNVFTAVDGACFKVLRTWSIIDWCNYSDINPDQYKYEHIQVIKVVNKDAPVIVSCRDTIFCVSEANCRGYVAYKNTATDICTPIDKLLWRHQVDLNNNGTIDFSGNSNDVSGTYNVGRHRIVWTVSDQCGNITTCTQIMIVRDCKKPTPYCLADLTTVLMKGAGFVDIWAKDFDKGSFDNCGGLLRYSFTSDTSNTSLRFDCTKIGIQGLKLYVTDTSGNQDFCQVNIIIQDNQNICGVSGGSASISGVVSTEKNYKLNNVEVRLENVQSPLMRSSMTNDNGLYSFNNITPSRYTIKASKDSDAVLGVNTLDLLAIQKHILSLKKLTSPYQLIAADANFDGTINVSDLVLLKRLVLGVTNDLKPNPAWRFVNSQYKFADPTKPWPFEESIDFEYKLNGSIPLGDFMAIKIGDVDGSATGFMVGNTSNRSVPNKTISYEINKLKKGLQTIQFYANDLKSLEGVQLKLQLDQRFSLINVESILPSFLKDQYFYNEKDNTVSIVWYNPQSINLTDEEAFITLTLSNTADMSPEKPYLNKNSFQSEIYTSDNTFGITLTEKGKKIGSNFVVYQNVPNPFTTTTIITYNLPQDGVVNIKFIEPSGKVLRNMKTEGKKGLNQYHLEQQLLDYHGLVYYEVEHNGHAQVRKMMIL